MAGYPSNHPDLTGIFRAVATATDFFAVFGGFDRPFAVPFSAPSWTPAMDPAWTASGFFFPAGEMGEG